MNPVSLLPHLVYNILKNLKNNSGKFSSLKN